MDRPIVRYGFEIHAAGSQRRKTPLTPPCPQCKNLEKQFRIHVSPPASMDPRHHQADATSMERCIRKLGFEAHLIPIATDISESLSHIAWSVRIPTSAIAS